MAIAEKAIKNLEFRSPESEAWYAVSIKCGNREGQPEGASYFDVYYEAANRTGQVYSVNLKDNNQVQETRTRLRCKSSQLKFWMCDNVQTEKPICAAWRSNKNKDPMYFDALVKKIVTVVKKFSSTAYDINLSATKTTYSAKVIDSVQVLWIDGPSKGEFTILKVEDIRLLSPVSIEAHPVIQFLERTLEENKKKGEAGDVRTSTTATDANYDHKLKSSVQSSSHTGKNASLIRLKQCENVGSTSLSSSSNSNIQHENVQKIITDERTVDTENVQKIITDERTVDTENVQKIITDERTVDTKIDRECKKAQFITLTMTNNLNHPDLNLPDKFPLVLDLNPGANAPFIQNLEFKSPEDDAWYAVSNYGKRSGQPEGASYFDVHYEGVHRTGQVYSVNLQEGNKVEETRARFRCKSIELRNGRCESIELRNDRRDVQSGTPICAAYRPNKKKYTKYFDAVLKKIEKLVKEFTKTVKDKILTVPETTFFYEVLWKDGPSKGDCTILTADDIRLLSPVSIEAHPVIQFLERALEKNLEFKSPEDDSWYAVFVKCGKRAEQPEGASYFDVYYEGVNRTEQVYRVNLKDRKEVEETRARFRCMSRQLRYWMCDDLQRGIPICAAYRSKQKKSIKDLKDLICTAYRKKKDAKYFDAVVKEIDKVVKELTFTETIYVFKILWKDGPSKDKLTLLHAQDIRLLSPVSIEAHPVIQFLERALKENKKNGVAGDIRTSKEAGKKQKLNHPDLNLPDKAPLVPDLSPRVRAPAGARPVPDLNVPVDMEVSDETQESNERSHK